MQTVVIDFETFWSTEHTLSKMNALTYCTHPDTEIISAAVKINDTPTQVYFGEEEIRAAFDEIDWSDSYVIGHNMSGFDSIILAWRFGVKPKTWGCTLAMARPIHSITVGGSLAKLVSHYMLGVKDQRALHNTKGRRLADFTAQEREDMATYNKADTDQCYALFHILKSHYKAKELMFIDWSIRMTVEPQFVADTKLLTRTLEQERIDKRTTLIELARNLNPERWMANDGGLRGFRDDDEIEEAVRQMLASAPKFAQFLEHQGVEVPLKPSPTDPGKLVPALAKTDEGFTALLESEVPVVAAAARARLEVKSTLLETRLEAFLESAAAAGGKLPVTTHYCGAATTGRRSGWLMNQLNLPRIPRDKQGNIIDKPTNALRMSMRAPKGYKVVVADLSGIELRFNHTLWQVDRSMRLWEKDPVADLYRATAAEMYNVKPEDVAKEQRQYAKVLHLACGYGMGPAKFRDTARLNGLNLSEAEAGAAVAQWRDLHQEITEGWKSCHKALEYILAGEELPIDPWGMFVTCPEGIRMPSGRLIRYPELRREKNNGKTEWFYGSGRNTARIYGGKIDENIVQAGSRDVMYDIIYDVYKLSKRWPALEVYDEAVYIVKEEDAEEFLAVLLGRMTKATLWFPALVKWAEGDVADSYGEAKG